MKNLYGKVTISKTIAEVGSTFKESINYYKLKNNKYGFEIVKENHEKKKLEITNVIDVTEDEEKINNILNILVNKEVMPNSSDIIEDLVKQYV